MGANALLTELIDTAPNEWRRLAACIGRWQEFDSVRQEVAQICWTECPVRELCLRDAMEYEMSNHLQANINYDGESVFRSIGLPSRTGIRGGYTPSDRQYIEFALELGASIAEY